MGRAKKHHHHHNKFDYNTEAKKCKKNKKMSPEDEKLFVKEIKELQSLGEPISWCKIDEKLFDRRYGVNFLYQKYNRCMKYKDNQILWTPSNELELLVLVSRHRDPVTGKISWQDIIRGNNFENCASTAQLSNRYKTICRDASLLREFEEMSEEKKHELVKQGNELRMKAYKQTVSLPSTARKSKLAAMKNAMNVGELEEDKENCDPNVPNSKKCTKRKKPDDTLYIPNIAHSKGFIEEKRLTRSQTAKIGQQKARKCTFYEWEEKENELEEKDSSSVVSSLENEEEFKVKKQRASILLSEVTLKLDDSNMESFVSKLNSLEFQEEHEEKDLVHNEENLREDANSITYPDIVSNVCASAEKVSSMDVQPCGMQSPKPQLLVDQSIELEIDMECTDKDEQLEDEEKEDLDYKIASAEKNLQAILKKKVVEPSIDELEAVFGDSNDSNQIHPSSGYSLCTENGCAWSCMSIASKYPPYNTDTSFEEEEVLEEQPSASAISLTNIDIYFNENL